MAEGNGQPAETDDSIEGLRLILEDEQQRPVTYGEALEVGESLLCFYEVLAEDTEPAVEDLLVQNSLPGF